MAVAGEVNQAIGRAYQFAFIAALEAHIKGFENRFTVEREPEKTSFDSRTGGTFSFDFSGVYFAPWRSCEVYGESKGYTRANDLSIEYKLFLAKAYVASTDYKRNRRDYFWFVTNVPFACREGRNICSAEYAMRALTDKKNEEVQAILGPGHIDEMLVWELTQNLAVFILTDSYLMNAELSYRVQAGDTIWAILKRFHAGAPPLNFRQLADDIAARNGLESADRIRSGEKILLRWPGIGLSPAESQSQQTETAMETSTRSC